MQRSSNFCDASRLALSPHVGMALRTYYSQDGDGNPTYKTRILDSKNRSLYYNTGNTSPTGNSYPKTVPEANRYIYRKPK